MKKAILVLAALVLVAAMVLSGCSSSSNSKDKTTTTTAPATEPVTEPEQTGKGALGDYEVEILSAETTKNTEGKDVVIITFNFTNNGEDSTSFFMAISEKAFQDGVELERAYFIDSDKYDSDAADKDIKSGASLQVQKAFILTSTTSKVEVECTEFISFNNAKVERAFDIA